MTQRVVAERMPSGSHMLHFDLVSPEWRTDRAAPAEVKKPVVERRVSRMQPVFSNFGSGGALRYLASCKTLETKLGGLLGATSKPQTRPTAHI